MEKAVYREESVEYRVQSIEKGVHRENVYRIWRPRV